MVAVSEAGLVLPADVSRLSADEELVERRRVVAIATSPLELLRPGSDLVRMIEGAGYVDLLFACEDEPVAEPSPVVVLAGVALDAVAAEAFSDEWADDGADDDRDDVGEELHATAARLGLDELHLHRLALRAPLSPAAEPDLVAALSELVGFDPEPGVRVLAPVPSATDPERAVLERAVRQIVQVYALPLERYRCLELAVVEPV
jgi:hypothetical protein